ncbi:hypothetical protein KP509_18G075900 [Ceratopteris richardii]|uniref:EF-hand domain-containing protein n=1 Tax=Ceratopteris richardii TaxID=49495 RepID=A0A8T2SVM6_CERRI|nr:hypothetical protein KP509_18G075900 [Ceratopteris richardii]
MAFTSSKTGSNSSARNSMSHYSKRSLEKRSSDDRNSGTPEIVVVDEDKKQVGPLKISLPRADCELEEAFRRFDADGDGKISPLELGTVLRSLGDELTEEDLILMVKEVDRDGDGFVDLQDFISMYADHASSRQEDLREAFKVFDRNSDGKISVEELYPVLSSLGESYTMEECGRMIQRYDSDGDGFMDFEDFCAMML